MFIKKPAFGALILVVMLFISLTPKLGQAQRYVPTADQLLAEQDRTESCPNCNHNLPRLNVYGWKGSPYFDESQGGCRCGQKSGLTWYNGDCHWPSPMSVLLDYGRNGCRISKSADTRHRRLRDGLDVFAKIRLLPPLRCDNGLTGRNCDPYGLLGESRRGVSLSELPNDPNVSEAGPSRYPLIDAKVETTMPSLNMSQGQNVRADQTTIHRDEQMAKEELAWRQHLVAQQNYSARPNPIPQSVQTPQQPVQQRSTPFVRDPSTLNSGTPGLPSERMAPVGFSHTNPGSSVANSSVKNRMLARQLNQRVEQNQLVPSRINPNNSLDHLVESGHKTDSNSVRSARRIESHGRDLPSSRTMGPTRLR